MGWEHRVAVPEHRCEPPYLPSPVDLPPLLRDPAGRRGEQWRCEVCDQLWRVGARCALCDRAAHPLVHGGQHTVGMAWRQVHESRQARKRRLRATGQHD
jgi:hypothetical protein